MNINVSKHGEGPPLVFFHGWGFDSHVWLTLVPELKSHYQVILVDLPGFDPSSPMTQWDVFKNNLLSQLPKQFTLVGWSMGGLYALRLALEAPHRIGALVNITSSPRFLVDESWPGIADHVFRQFYKQLVDHPQKTLKEFIELHAQGMEEKTYLPNPIPSPSSLEMGLHVLETWDFRKELNELTIPTCFMYGRLDPIVPVKAMKVMELTYPHLHYVVFPRAGHMPFLSHSELFIKELREFIP